MRHIPQRLAAILKDVVAKRHPEWLRILQADNPPAFDSQQRFALQQACGDEICEAGLTKDDEPNEYGLLLEELIDLLGNE